MRKSYFFAFIPGISAENSVPSISIGRPIRFASSFARSMLKPSSPPPSLGIACGANVASMPVLIGACAVAVPAAIRHPAAKAANNVKAPFMCTSRVGRKRLIAGTPARGERGRSDPAVHPIVGLAHHRVLPAPVPALCVRLDPGKHLRTGAVLLRQTALAEGAYFPEERRDVNAPELAVLEQHLAADHDRPHVLPDRTLHERFGDVGPGVEPGHPLDAREIHEHG